MVRSKVRIIRVRIVNRNRYILGLGLRLGLRLGLGLGLGLGI